MAQRCEISKIARENSGRTNAFKFPPISRNISTMASRYKVSFRLHGHTFEEVIADKQSLQINCEACTRRAVWPLAFLIERQFTDYIYKTAKKLRCSVCGGRDLFVTVHIPTQQ